MRRGLRALGLPRTVVNRGRCTLRLIRPRSTRVQSTLLAKPLRHPALDFFLLDEFAVISSFDATLNRLAHIDVVLDIFVRSVLRQRIEKLPHFVFWFTHAFYSTLASGRPNGFAAPPTGASTRKNILGTLRSGKPLQCRATERCVGSAAAASWAALSLFENYSLCIFG